VLTAEAIDGSAHTVVYDPSHLTFAPTNFANSYDVNVDGAANISDLLAVVQHLRKKQASEGESIDAAFAQHVCPDVNADGAVSVVDLVEIVQFLRKKNLSEAEGELGDELELSITQIAADVALQRRSI
jgi:hypothetical protein